MTKQSDRDKTKAYLRRQFDELHFRRGFSPEVILEAADWAAQMNRIPTDDEMAQICRQIGRVRVCDPRGEVKPRASVGEITMLCRDVAGEPIN